MRTIVTLIATLTLAACGSKSATDLDTASVPAPPLDRMYRIIATHNSALSTNFHVLGEAQGVDPLCSRTSCITRTPHPLSGIHLALTGQALPAGPTLRPGHRKERLEGCRFGNCPTPIPPAMECGWIIPCS